MMGFPKLGASEANVARDQALEDLRSEEATEVRGDLPRKCRSFIIHRQENAFDFEAWIQSSPNAHKRIQQFGYAFESEVFTLNGDEHGPRSYQSVEGQQIQCGRAIQQDEFVFFFQRLDCGPEFVLALLR